MFSNWKWSPPPHWKVIKTIDLHTCGEPLRVFTGDPYDKINHSRNVCIFANGELDRSPTGSGISAQAAIHYYKGDLKNEQLITIESILGTLMEVKIVNTLKFGSYDAVIPEVTGSASITGQNEFYFDPEDPIKEGFILR